MEQFLIRQGKQPGHPLIQQGLDLVYVFHCSLVVPEFPFQNKIGGFSTEFHLLEIDYHCSIGLIEHKNVFMLAQIPDPQMLIPEGTPGHVLNSIYGAGLVLRYDRKRLLTGLVRIQGIKRQLASPAAYYQIRTDMSVKIGNPFEVNIRQEHTIPSL